MKKKPEIKETFAPRKTHRWFFAGLTLAILVVVGTATYYFLQSRPSAVLARVNGVEITRHEVDYYGYLSLMQSWDPTGIDNEMKAEKNIGAYTLQVMIDRQLLLQEAKKRGISVSEKAVAFAYSNYIASYSDESDYKIMLKEVNATEKEAEDMVADNLTIEALMNSLVPDSSVTDRELQAFYIAHRTCYAGMGGFTGNKKQVKADYLADARPAALNKLLAQLTKTADIRK